MPSPLTLRILLAAGLLMAGAAAQPTLNVPTAQYPTIQFAINVAANGSLILAAPGTYSESINFAGKAVTVRGSAGASQTVLQGTGGGRVVSFVTGEGSGSILDGFTVQGGNGGIFIQNASPVIMNCDIANNTAATTSGGGLRCWATAAGAASPTITGCTLRSNATYFAGGGLHLTVDSGASSVFVLNNCSILANMALSSTPTPSVGGGGVSIANSGACSATLIGCTLNDNYAVGYGGGLRADSPTTIQLTSCRIQNNSATQAYGYSFAGGGIYVTSTQISTTNCLVTGNSAVQAGGGFNLGAPNGASMTATVRNCTVAGNVCTNGTGGGIAVSAFSGNQSGTTNIASSIVEGNSGLDVSVDVYPSSGPSTVTATFSLIGFGIVSAGQGTIAGDPLFVDAANDDYHLASSSPCRNAGQPGATGLPLTDLDLTPRIVGTVDMGADEVPATALAGTYEDLDVWVKLDGSGDPLAQSRPAAPGQTLELTFVSPGGGFAGAAPFLVGQIFSSATPPGGTPGFAGVRVNLGVPYTTIYGGLFGPPFPAPGLPTAGVSFAAQVPPGLAGNSLRVQGFVISPLAANFLYAATRAADVVF